MVGNFSQVCRTWDVDEEFAMDKYIQSRVYKLLVQYIYMTIDSICPTSNAWIPKKNDYRTTNNY